MHGLEGESGHCSSSGYDGGRCTSRARACDTNAGTRTSAGVGSYINNWIDFLDDERHSVGHQEDRSQHRDRR